MGVYSLLEDETCWFLAADFDKASWKEDVAAFGETCRSFGVPVAIERSRSGNGRQVLQYQLIGNEPLGRGPLMVLLDKSGSMDGPRDIWATALSLALLDQAQCERRTFALLAFDYRVKFEAVVKPGEPLPEEALFTACAGGTEIGVALARGPGAHP
jgi:hypothetical protein